MSQDGRGGGRSGSGLLMGERGADEVGLTVSSGGVYWGVVA
jgi:hypothetical protein